jgi:small-conductance mechanosensitive channel
MPNESLRTLIRESNALKGTAAASSRLAARRRLRFALITGLAALLVLIVSSTVFTTAPHSLNGHLVLAGPTIGFLLLAVTCIRATAAEVDDLFRWRGGRNAGSTARMLVTIIGYLFAGLGALDLMAVPIGHLLVGGAIAGIVVGIAAQQSLGNVFAGIVLLMARPFAIGNHIRVRSGALGGEFHGTVVAMSLTYVSISTPDGMLKVPNSSLLAVAVGPWHPESEANTVITTDATEPAMADRSS